MLTNCHEIALHSYAHTHVSVFTSHDSKQNYQHNTHRIPDTSHPTSSTTSVITSNDTQLEPKRTMNKPEEKHDDDDGSLDYDEKNLPYGWAAQFEAWKRYSKEHKTPHVNCSINATLHRWVSVQRKRFFQLNVLQIELLDKAGFVWHFDYRTPEVATHVEHIWLKRFEEWKEYFEKYKDPHVNSTSHCQLYQWYRRQRNNRDRLKLAQRELLDKAGFPWESRVRTAIWMKSFEAWKRYFEEHKTPYVPSRESALSRWVHYQREHRDTLSAWKVERLESAGFKWEGVLFEKKLSQENGHPRRRSSRLALNNGKVSNENEKDAVTESLDSDGNNESRHLTKRMGRYRNVISSTLKTGDDTVSDTSKSDAKAENDKANESRTHSDEKNVKFSHDTSNSKDDKKIKSNSQRLEDHVTTEIPCEWKYRFEDWKQYYDKYRVPDVHSKINPKLYDWVRQQRNQRDKLSAVQIELLDKAGFAWQDQIEDWALTKTPKRWRMLFLRWKQHVQKYKCPHGSCDIEESVFRWVRRQRRERWRLSELQLRLLDENGFVWEGNSVFSNLFENWKKFYKERKKPIVHWKEDKKLYRWTSRLRKDRYDLPAWQRNLLDNAGFVWEVGDMRISNNKQSIPHIETRKSPRVLTTSEEENDEEENDSSDSNVEKEKLGKNENKRFVAQIVKTRRSPRIASSTLTSDGVINDNNVSKVANDEDRERKSSAEEREDQRKSNKLSDVTSHVHGKVKIESDSKKLETVGKEKVNSAKKREHRCNSDISLLKKIHGKADNKSECNTKIEINVENENLEDMHLLTSGEQTRINQNPSLAFGNDEENNCKKQKVEKDDNCESSVTEKIATCSRKRNNSVTSTASAKMVACSRKRINSFISTTTSIVDGENENTSKFEKVDNDVNRNIMNKDGLTRSIDSFTPTSKEKSERQTDKQLSEIDDLTRTGVDINSSLAQDDTTLSKNKNSVNSSMTKVNAKVDDKSQSNTRKQTVRIYEKINNMGHLKRGGSLQVSHSPSFATRANENDKIKSKKRKSRNFDSGESALSEKIRRCPGKTNSSTASESYKKFDDDTEKNAKKQVVDINRGRDNAETKIFSKELDNCARVMVKTSINDDRLNTERLVSGHDNIDKSSIPSRMVRISSPTKSDGAMFDIGECDTDGEWVGWESKRESLHLGGIKNDNHVDSIHLARLVETSRKVSESSSKTFDATKIYCKNNIGKQNTDNDSTKAYGKINDNCESISKKDEVRNRHLAMSKTFNTYGYPQASTGWTSNNTCDSSRRYESERWCSRGGNRYISKTSCGLENKDVSIIFSIV